MNGSMLFENMVGIEDAFLEQSEKPKKRMSMRVWLSAAACVAAVAATVLVLSGMGQDAAFDPMDHDGAPITDGTLPDGGSETEWKAIYNPAEYSGIAGDRAFAAEGYFTEELSAEEISAIEPEKRADWMNYSGFAGFEASEDSAKLLHILLRVSTTDADSMVLVWISKTPIENLNCCYVLPGEPALSVCGETEFEIYEYSAGGHARLEAYCEQFGLYFAFEMGTEEEKLGQAKSDFETILESFTHYSGGPDLSAVNAEYIPEMINRELAHSEALAEEDFGAYMLKKAPDGFGLENILRFKNQHKDYLSALWSRGYDDLDWTVKYYTDEDEKRIISVSDTENYDLGLYPIPMAESVPEHLRETVDNPIFEIEDLTLEAVMKRARALDDMGDSGGLRMRFTVKYGDILVEISSKGVSPEWIYEQLIALK